MAINYSDLRDELLSGHPVTGAYNANNKLAADELNALNRDAPGGVLGMLEYVLKNRSRTNAGTDLTPTAIVGRLQSVAEGTVGVDPFGAGQNLTMEHIHAAKMFMLLLRSDPQTTTFDFVNAEVSTMMDILGGGSGNARVWKSGDIDALKGLSQNKQSRASELGWRKIQEGDVEYARTL